MGGQLPGERLKRLRGSALSLAPLVRAWRRWSGALVDALAEAEPAVHRRTPRRLPPDDAGQS